MVAEGRNDWAFTWQTVTASLPRSCVKNTYVITPGFSHNRR